jgi:hypothetical protein
LFATLSFTDHQISYPVAALIFIALARFCSKPLLPPLFLLCFLRRFTIWIPPVYIVGSWSNLNITGAPDGSFNFMLLPVKNSGIYLTQKHLQGTLTPLVHPHAGRTPRLARRWQKAAAREAGRYGKLRGYWK